MTEISKQIHEMILKHVSYRVTETIYHNGSKFSIIYIVFNTKTGTTRFEYDFQCNACRCSKCKTTSFRSITDTEKHTYECSCNECMSPTTRPPIQRYCFIEKYKTIDGGAEFLVSKNTFDENILRTKYPEWVREEYAAYESEEEYVAYESEEEYLPDEGYTF